MRFTPDIRLLLACVPVFMILGAAAPYAPSQAQIPIGYTMVDDMILPIGAVWGDSAWNATPWPNGVVTYGFNANVNAANQNAARRAMDEIEAVCGVVFVRGTGGDRIVFNNALVNNSFVGMTGGAQIINIVNWNFPFVIVHEIMHALGYIHEQSRPDRDMFVTVNNGANGTPNNVQNTCGANQMMSCQNNFAIVQGVTQTATYDYNSVMHYGPCAFSINCATSPTVVAPPGAPAANMGQRQTLSLLDVQGLQTRYGLPQPPVITNLPSIVTVGSTAVVTLTGNRIASGGAAPAPNNLFIQGTQVWVNNVPVPSTVIDPGMEGLPPQISFTLTPAMTAAPGVIQVRLFNPSSNAGPSQPRNIYVQCSSSLSLAYGATATAFGCEHFSIPVASTNDDWKVVGVSSTSSNYDIYTEQGTSTYGGSTTDFVVANGNNGPYIPYGEIFPNAPGTATVEHPTTWTFAPGTIVDTYIAAGRVLKPHQFNITQPGWYDITVSGNQALRWRLFEPGNDASWRGAASAALDRPVGGSTVQRWLDGGWHLLVVSTDGGAAPDFRLYTANVCPTTAVQTASNGIPAIITNTCQPFSMFPLSGRWNVVGITSDADWDVTMGPAESQNGSGQCDYLVANGRAGSITPTSGLFARFSGSNSATAEHGATLPITPGTSFSRSFGASRVIECLEFDAGTGGVFSLTVSGSSFLGWSVHGPGGTAAWRPRAESSAFSGNATGNLTTLNLGPGWHALVVHRNGSTGVSGNYSVTLSGSQNPQPILTSVTPSTIIAGSSSVTITCDGSGFVAASEIRVGGTPLATNLVSPNQVNATVLNATSLFSQAGTYDVRVVNPPWSNILTITVENPAPQITSMSPSSAFVGSPSQLVSVFGSGFTPQTAVWWVGGLLSNITYVSPNQVDVLIPFTNLLNPGSFDINVFNPAPGGGQSSFLQFTVGHLIPVITSLSPSSVPAGSPATTLTVHGSAFHPGSVITLNGSSLPTTFLSSSKLNSVVPQSMLAVAGLADIRVVNPTPGGGPSTPQPLNITVGPPTIAAMNPPAAICGTPTFSMTIDGTNFTSSSQVTFEGLPVATVFVSDTTLSATIPNLLIESPVTATVKVVNPISGGTAAADFPVFGPLFTAVTPAVIPVMTPSSAPQTITVDGKYFHPGSLVYADGSPLPTVFVNQNQLTATIEATVLGTQDLGAMAITASNSRPSASNMGVLRVGGVGSNKGIMRRHPLAPAPGEAYALLLEGGRINAPFSLIVDLTNPAAVHPWPDPTADWVLNVRPFPPGTGGWLAILDGAGLYGPPTGHKLDDDGNFNHPFFTMPNPSLGIDMTVQGVFVDPSGPFGYNITWARFPDSI